MAKKGNIRNMRFSDEILEMIESQAGETFTAKFEALVTRCMWELPRKEQELKEIQKQIENERKNLRRIRDRRSKLDYKAAELENRLNTLLRAIDRDIKELEEP